MTKPVQIQARHNWFTITSFKHGLSPLIQNCRYTRIFSCSISKHCVFSTRLILFSSYFLRLNVAVCWRCCSKLYHKSLFWTFHQLQKYTFVLLFWHFASNIPPYDVACILKSVNTLWWIVTVLRLFVLKMSIGIQNYAMMSYQTVWSTVEKSLQN